MQKKLFTILSVFSILLFFSCKKGEYKPNSGKTPPSEKLKLTCRIVEPSTWYGRETPDQLVLYFDGSAAKLEDVGKMPSGSISIIPEIAGSWIWENDSSLIFQPTENWKLDTKYKITLGQNLFADNVSVKAELSFTTEEFTAKLRDTNFAVDPEDPNIKKVYTTISTSNPMQKEEIEKFITLTLESKGSKNTVKTNIGFTVSFNKSATEAYIASDNIPVPPKTSELSISLKAGIKSADGSAASKQADSDTVEVPGLSDYVRINNISHNLVKNNDNNLY